MTRPTVAQAQSWRPDSLADVADAWDRAAGELQTQLDVVLRGVADSRDIWTGAAADHARAAAESVASAARRTCRALVTAAVAARDGTTQIASAREAVLTAVADARDEGCLVADDGAVTPPGQPPPLLTALTGGDTGTACGVLGVRAQALNERVGDTLDRLGGADADTARDIAAAFAALHPAAVRPAGSAPVSGADMVAGWPAMSQDRIAAQIAAMTPAQRDHLIDDMPTQVGNTDGVPWAMRAAANRVNIANAILDERRVIDSLDDQKLREAMRRNLVPGASDPAALVGADAERMWAMLHTNPQLRAAAIAAHDRDANRRIAFYQGLLADVPDAVRPEDRVGRQILAFDPDRSSLVELYGDLRTAKSVGVLVPGLNTTVEGSAPNTATARRLVAGGRGDVAMITYLGGPFPTGEFAAGVADAADPRYAREMAPRLVAFSEDVNRTVDGLGRAVPITYIGHSYGGSILGTAEKFGLTADRVIYVEAAGAGVGVHSPADWHNRNPKVLRFSMTAPGDWIEAVQGIPLGPHGADPDDMPGVTRLAAGRTLTGAPMMGPATHSDVLNEPSDAWHNILAVITGDRDRIRIGQ